MTSNQQPRTPAGTPPWARRRISMNRDEANNAWRMRFDWTLSGGGVSISRVTVIVPAGWTVERYEKYGGVIGAGARGAALGKSAAALLPPPVPTPARTVPIRPRGILRTRRQAARAGFMVWWCAAPLRDWG
jgi:hypothetical protein